MPVSKKARRHRRPLPSSVPARTPGAAGADRGRRPRPANRDARPFWERHATAIAGAVVLVGVVGLGAWVFVQSTRPAYACQSLLTPPPATPTPAATATPGASPTAGATPAPTPLLGFTVPDRGSAHGSGSDTITYLECPPASGTHDPVTARRGYYPPDSSIRPGAWIHSLEHGLVVVLYSCGGDGTGCPDGATLDALEAFAENAPQTDVARACGIKNKAIVARFDEMTTRFAALSWDRVMLDDTFDAPAFLAFYEQWVDRAPTSEAEGCDR